MAEDGLFRIEGDVAPGRRIEIAQAVQEVRARFGDAQTPGERTGRRQASRACDGVARNGNGRHFEAHRRGA